MTKYDLVIQDLYEETDRLITRTNRLAAAVTSSMGEYASVPSVMNYYATQESRAAAILYSMAELESLTRFFLAQINKALSGQLIQIKEVRACLRQLVAHEIFESLRSLNDHKKIWTRRSSATTMDVDSNVLTLPVVGRPRSQPPLDGKTPKPDHYALIWSIYGFPSEPFKVGSWETTLRKLSGLRNDLAHGNYPFDEVFKSPGLKEQDILGYLSDIELFALHMVTTIEEYLTHELYLVGH